MTKITTTAPTVEQEWTVNDMQYQFNDACKHGHGKCTAPNTNCPHWMGTFCEMEDAYSLLYADMEEIIDAADLCGCG